MADAVGSALGTAGPAESARELFRSLTRRNVADTTATTLTIRAAHARKQLSSHSCSASELSDAYRFSLRCMAGCSFEMFQKAGQDPLSSLFDKFTQWSKQLPSMHVLGRDDQTAIVQALASHAAYLRGIPGLGGEMPELVAALEEVPRRQGVARFTPQELLAVLVSATSEASKTKRAVLERQLKWLLFLHSHDTELTVRAMKLKAAFGMSDDAHGEAMALAVVNAGPQSQLAELRQRKAFLNAHPLYSRSSFESEDVFRNWARSESEYLESLVSMLTKQCGQYSQVNGMLRIRVFGLRGGVQEFSSPFCEVSVKGEKRKTRPMSCKTNEPFWGDEFLFFFNSKSDLSLDTTIAVMEKDSLKDSKVGKATFKVFLPQDDKQSTSGTVQWINVGTTKSGSQLDLCVETRSFMLPSEFSPLPPYHMFYKIAVEKLLAHDRLTRVPDSSRALEEFNLPLHVPLTKGITRDLSRRCGLEKIAPMINLGVIASALEAEVSRAMLQCAHRQIDAVRINPKELAAAEATYFRETVSALRNACKPWVVKYFVLVPEPDVLELLLNLCVRAEGLCCAPGADPNAVLEEYVRLSAQFTIEIESSVAGNGSSSTMTYDGLISIIDGMASAIERDEAQYAKLFSKWTDLLQLECDEFSRFLSSNVISTVDTPAPDAAKAMALYVRVRDITRTFKKHVPSHVNLPLCALFNQHVLAWLEASRKKFSEWMQNAVKADPWKPISDKSPHSSSVIDVFASFASAIEFVEFLDYGEFENPAPKAHFVEGVLAALTSVVCRVTRSYVRAVEEKATEILGAVLCFPLLTATEAKPEAPVLKALATACVCMSDCEAACAHLEEFLTRVEKVLAKAGCTEPSEAASGSISKAMGEAKRAHEAIVSAISSKMAEPLYKLLFSDITGAEAKPRRKLKERMLEKAKRVKSQLLDDNHSAATPQPQPQQQPDDPVFYYLNLYLEFVSDRVFRSSFKRVLRGVWATLVRQLETVAMGRHQEGLPVDLHSDFMESIALLARFFEADGEGLRESVTETDVKLLKSELTLCTLDLKDVRAVHSGSAAGSLFSLAAERVIALKERERKISPRASFPPPSATAAAAISALKRR